MTRQATNRWSSTRTARYSPWAIAGTSRASAMPFSRPNNLTWPAPTGISGRMAGWLPDKAPRHQTQGRAAPLRQPTLGRRVSIHQEQVEQAVSWQLVHGQDKRYGL